MSDTDSSAMKKFFIILSLLPFLLSCQVRPSTNWDETMRLRTFSYNLVETAVISPVLTLEACDRDKSKDIFSSGFAFEADGVRVELISAADSTWKAVQVGGSSLAFNTVVRMLPDNVIGLHEWSVGTEGLWTEDRGYKAVLSTTDPAHFHWLENSSVAYYSFSEVLSGKFEVTTSLNGKDLDRCSLTFTDSSADGYSYGDCKIDVTALR